jgi:hypothetical protein
LAIARPTLLSQPNAFKMIYLLCRVHPSNDNRGSDYFPAKFGPGMTSSLSQALQTRIEISKHFLPVFSDISASHNECGNGFKISAIALAAQKAEKRFCAALPIRSP